MRVRIAFSIGFATALALGLALVALRPHVAQRYGLYLGAPRDPAAHLFLDPFPDAASCETRVRVFAANGERAFCTAHYDFETGTADDARLAADFDPLSPASWFCLPRWASARFATLRRGSPPRPAPV